MNEHTGFHDKEHHSPDCPGCEQDLLLTDIGFGVTLTYSDEWYKRTYKEKPDTPVLFIATGKVKEAPKGHYLITVIREGTGYVQEYHISFLAKVHNHRLDRPDREKIEAILKRCLADKGKYAGYDKGYVIDLNPYIDEFLALFPDEFEVEDEFVKAFAKDYLETHEALHKVDIEDAKREFMAELKSVARPTHGGNRLIIAPDWKRLIGK